MSNELRETEKNQILDLYYDPLKGLTNPRDIYKKLHKKIKLSDIKYILSNIELHQIYIKQDKSNYVPFSANAYASQNRFTI